MPAKQTKQTKHAGGKAVKKSLKVKGGSASRYTTRNQALNRLQLKLADFRRLCILKGIHPRCAPTRERLFLLARRRRISRIAGAPPPLSLTFRPPPRSRALAPFPRVTGAQEEDQGPEQDVLPRQGHQFPGARAPAREVPALRAYERKIKKAKAKKAHHAVDRLEERKPQYGLDHLVKERYPSFVDAIRDLDDPLTLVHLFALLPADKRHGIPAEVVNRSRALALEFQSYVTKTHSLRKVFISVKGIYYQASIYGQEVTWLTPHAVADASRGCGLPRDADVLEFYVAMMGFVNYKLYYDRSFRYPPLLDTRLEDAAGGIVAVIHDLADKVHGEASGARAIAGAAKKTSDAPPPPRRVWARSRRRWRLSPTPRWTTRRSRRRRRRRRARFGR